ncbi:(Fe-S)-binding protein [Anaerococcus sp. Marseille-P3625]|uniref:(Fe-S)-binding protein n=1 Tax=Anaerococcus sp. Marseille-P3625 TaxID=1977277 RepID=UPI000C07DC90|nr:(Fe-S)-binding protein [Anaerococcus sp. Marseille-P3625]
MDYLKNVEDNCIECGLCTKNCTFLEKYSINLKDFIKREDLAFSCFECNKCQSVCPKDLNGKYVSELLRKKNPKYKFIKITKDFYPYRNLARKNKYSKDLLYLGCNFPAFYPETSRKLVEIFSSKDFDFSIDCCRKPVASTGFDVTTSKSLEKQIRDKDIKRIVTACPNCYHFLKNKYMADVISIFQWLEEYDYINDINEPINIFFPCSDRYNREIFEVIKKHAPKWNDKFTSTNCCGAGGLASKCESKLANDMISSIKDDEIYTYCATCSMNFSKYNKVHHLISAFLGMDEEVNNNFFKNAVKGKFLS